MGDLLIMDNGCMKIFCFDCSKFSLRNLDGKVIDVAHVGLGNCPTRTQPGHYVAGGYPRECGNFEPSEEGQGDKIRKWVDQHYKNVGIRKAA